MNFIILKVNGIDVSNSSHEDVMKILNQAKQPVQVEILTKEDEKSSNNVQNLQNIQKSQNVQNIKQTSKPAKVDKQVQTDSKCLDELISQHCFKCQYELNLKDLCNKGSDSDEFYEVLDYSDNHIEELEDDFIEENCDAFEYKELSWSKGTTESVGLVLDKLLENENPILKTEIVYIKEIRNPALQSILRVGDQILEINGIATTNLNDARSRLDNPLANEFNILFSRLNADHDHKICEQRIELRKQKLNWLKLNAIRQKDLINGLYFKSDLDNGLSTDPTNNQTINSAINRHVENEYDNEKLQNKDEKDSGIGKTDQESVYTRTNETCSSNEYDTFNSPTKASNDKPASGLKQSSSSTSLEKEIFLLNKEMENIKYECELLNRNYKINNCQNKSSHLNLSPKTGQFSRQLSDLSNEVSVFNDRIHANEKKESIKKWIKNGKSRPNKNLITDNLSNRRLSNSQTVGNLVKRSGSMISLKSIEYQNDCIIKQTAIDCSSEHEYAVINYENASSLLDKPHRRAVKLQKPPPLPPLNSSRKNSSNLDDQELRMPSVTMYTNKANLHQTILLQQQLLRKALEKKHLLINCSNGETVNVSKSSKISQHQSVDAVNKGDLFNCKKIDKNKFLLNNSIIKLKRKSDGTKYISKKLIDENEVCRQKIINCNRNLINKNSINYNCKLFEGDEEAKLRKSREIDCKHSLRARLAKRTNHNFFNGLKPKVTKSNEKLEEKLKKLKIQDNLVMTSKNDIFTVATV